MGVSKTKSYEQIFQKRGIISEHIIGILTLGTVVRPVTLNKLKVKVSVAQSCLALCYPMDCSLPGSSVGGFLQARILEPFPFPGESSQPRDQIWISCIAITFFNHLSHQGSIF